MGRSGWLALAVAALVIPFSLVGGCTTTTAQPTATATSLPTQTPTIVCAVRSCTPSQWFPWSGTSSIVPSLTPQVTASTTLAAGQTHGYEFCCVAGVTYTFSTCSNGGTSTSPFSTCGVMPDCSDWTGWTFGSCTNGNWIAWTAPVSGPIAFVAVSSTGSTYSLAYWHN